MQLKVVINLFKKCRLPMAILIITAAIISSFFRALTPLASHYRTDLEAHLSRVLGEPVHIEKMETGWYWFDPVIKLKEISIVNGEKQVIQLKKLLVGINLFSSFWHWQVRPGVLYLDDMNLVIHQQNDNWQLEGLDAHQNQPILMEKTNIQLLLGWLLNQQKIIVKHLSAQVYMADGRLIPIKQLNFVISRYSQEYRIKGEAVINDKNPTVLNVIAKIKIDFSTFIPHQGEIFLGLKNINFSEWANLLPAPYLLSHLKGQGNIKTWIELDRGKIHLAQAKLNLKSLNWQDTSAIYPDIQALKGNIAWVNNDKTWRLSADDFNLRMNGVRWPKNNFLLQYNKNQDSYELFMKHTIIHSILHAFTWLNNKDITKLNPLGHLEDTYLKIKDNQVQELMTRFNKLSWQPTEKIFGVDNLSGVVHWLPNSGKLALNAHKTTVNFKELPPIQLSLANAATEWKKDDQGLTLQLERVILKNSDLLLTTQGRIEHIHNGQAGQIDLNAQLSGRKVEKWLKYLPNDQLKPKLEYWLKNEVKQIDSMVADIHVHGLWEDFPFDKRPGEFTIKSHLQGVDLVFAPGWPLAKNIEGYLSFDKRLLTADIVHANLLGVLLNKANLHIDDIGNDKETLLLHAKADTDSNKALYYVLHSPLKNKLSALSLLKMKGDMSMDFRLEAPLYGEDGEILALGDIDFLNNKVLVRHNINDVQLTGLNGSLQFDQNGVLDSNLHALVMNYPINIVIQSVRSQKPYTEIKILGKTTIDFLREKLNLPILLAMRGEFVLESLLTLTDEPSDLDHLQVKTSLKGVDIDLPAPFGKKASMATPLLLDIDFNPEKALRLQMNYHNLLTGDVWFKGRKGDLHLEGGHIRIGNAPLREHLPGLQIVAQLEDFDWQPWQKVMSQWPKAEESLWSFVKYMQFNVRRATLGGHHYKDVMIKALKTAHESWAIQLNEQNMMAHLDYDPKFNLISGNFDKLIFKTNHSDSAQDANLQWQAKNMPNLDIDIKNLEYNDILLGSASIRALNQESGWRLDNFHLQSENYTVSAKGMWRQSEGVNRTHIQSMIDIKNIGNTLEQFHTSPVVVGHQGVIKFDGQWPGGFHALELSHLSGDLNIQLRNGRITHLSPETEEKLGLGKLLSILSLQTIPRRLKLDFSDLSQDGYSFDIFEGHFKIEQGMMTTNDSYIDGPIAYASMKGNLDITRQLYNLDLKVNPHVTASLPIVATIAGGPLVGFATWVASKIINQGMQKISGYTYTVTGPWKEPLVEQTKIFKKKKAA